MPTAKYLPGYPKLLSALLCLVALTAAACGGSDDSDSSAEATPVPTATVSSPTATPEDATESGSEPDGADEPEAAPTAVATATPDPAPAYDFSALAPVVEDFIDAKELNGAGLIIVTRDDGVVYHEHWGEFDEDRISLIASSSKMIVASVLLRLQDDGLLDMNAPVADVVEWGAANPTITPAQLVSNSSGLVGLLDDPSYGPYLCQFSAAGTLQECASAIFTTEADDDDISPPDTRFRYGGGQWQVAGAVAEAASGKSWAQLVDELIVQPCELEVLAFNNHFAALPGGFSYPAGFDSDPSVLEPTENPNLEGGAYVTTGDYAKLLLMHLRDGRCGENQVLSTDALTAMHSDRIAAVYDGDAYSPTSGYGMGWWVERETGYIADGGAYGSMPWLDLEDGYGAFLILESTSRQGNDLADELQPLVELAITGSPQ